MRSSRWALVALALAAFLAWRWLARDGLAVERFGSDPADARAALILLHGYGAGGDDLAGLARELAAARPELHVAVPAGPHSARGFGRTWVPDFTAESREAYAERLVREVEQTRASLWRLVEALRADGMAEREIYVGGFSLGGRMALELAAHAPEGDALAGALVLSGGGLAELPPPDASGQPQMRVLFSHGTRDPVVGIGIALGLAHRLAADGHEVRFLRFDGPHAIPDAVRDAIPAFLDGEDVGEPVVP